MDMEKEYKEQEEKMYKQVEEGEDMENTLVDDQNMASLGSTSYSGSPSPFLVSPSSISVSHSLSSNTQTN